MSVARRVDADVGWLVRNGVSRQDATVRTEDGTEFLIAEGTVGVNECTRIEERNGCVFFADTLGDAVVWFALVDRRGSE